MKLLSDILRFRDALGVGYFQDIEKRAVYTLTFEEAMGLFHELQMTRERGWLYSRVNYALYDPLVQVTKMPIPEISQPEPGRIWGRIYGVNVFVQGEPRATGEGLRLLQEAMHIRMFGERAPGGNENWRDWEIAAGRHLRGDRD